MPKFKQKCSKCGDFTVVTRVQSNPVCYNCQKDDLVGIIDDTQMAQVFDIPEQLYMENGFLRNIKINYLRFGKLTDRQVEAFQKVVTKELKQFEK